MSYTPTFTSFDHIVWYYAGACPSSERMGRMCGCGYPEEPYQFIRDALLAINSDDIRRFERPPFGGIHRGAQALLVELLGDMGLVEHGSSWFSSFLTPAGDAALAVLGVMADDAISSAYEAQDVTGCYGDDCPHCKAFGTEPLEKPK